MASLVSRGWESQRSGQESTRTVPCISGRLTAHWLAGEVNEEERLRELTFSLADDGEEVTCAVHRLERVEASLEEALQLGKASGAGRSAHHSQCLA